MYFEAVVSERSAQGSPRKAAAVEYLGYCRLGVNKLRGREASTGGRVVNVRSDIVVWRRCWNSCILYCIKRSMFVVGGYEGYGILGFTVTILMIIKI